jgi:hypothetical protein
MSRPGCRVGFSIESSLRRTDSGSKCFGPDAPQAAGEE